MKLKQTITQIDAAEYDVRSKWQTEAFMPKLLLRVMQFIRHLRRSFVYCNLLRT